jgi:hypothetical protein
VCWKEYLDQREREQQEDGDNCTTRRFVILNNKMEVHSKCWSKNVKERYHLENLDVDW